MLVMEVVYWADDRGRVPVREYLDALGRYAEVSAIASFRRGISLLEEDGPAIGMPHARLIDRQLRLYELRFGHHRAAYVEHQGIIVMLHAWRKR